MTHSQRRFLTQHIVSMLEQCWKHLKQCRNNVVTLCYAKNRRCESSRVGSPWRTWTYYDEFPFVFLSLNKILKNSTPGKVESLKECKFIFWPSFSLPPLRRPCLSSLMTTRVAEGLEGARQERLVHLFSHLLLPKRTRALPSLYLEKRRDCLQSLRAWRKKIWVWTW